MWELDHKESWVPKNWCFWTVVLEKTLGSPLDCKEIKPFNSKGNQSWIVTGRTDAEAEAPSLWPPYAKNWLIGKNPDPGKDWRPEEKGMTEDEMLGWHHQLDGRSLSKLWDLLIVREAWHAVVQGVAKSSTWLSDWTEISEPSTITSLIETASSTLPSCIIWKTLHFLGVTLFCSFFIITS